MIIVMMGVSGSGKTTIGELLARRLSCEFADADDYHSAGNKAKMHSGVPLTDEDRLPWLKNLTELFKTHDQSGQSLVLACSALKESYRKLFSDSATNIVFVYLKADFETVASRLENRQHEFMNPDLLKSQFETLEEPQEAITVDADKSPCEIVDYLISNIDV